MYFDYFNIHGYTIKSQYRSMILWWYWCNITFARTRWKLT